MTVPTPSTRTVWRSAIALAGVTGAFLLGSTEARTAGPRPLFQMPVPCGQTWEASTYKEHWNGLKDPAGPNAIDLAQRNGSGANLSEGEPALASAAGTVEKVYTASNGEHRVFIDHGGGWRTDYVHLESVPPLEVGQHVAQGEMVGRISNSGTTGMHLHYNQMKDGHPARISFNGKLIDTHAGNKASWGTWGSDDAEKLTSLNCPGNAFLAFNQNGLRYQLIYKPASGSVKIVRLKPDGKGVTTVFDDFSQDLWTQRLTHLVPFTLVGGQQHLFAYKASTGEVRFDRMNAKGEGTTALAKGTWGKGWTHFTPFSLLGRPYFIAYDSINGYANIDRINVEGSGSTKIYGTTWTKGWTHFSPYVLGGVQYVLLYKGGTGEVEIDKITGSGNDLAVTEVWSDTWSAGWTHLVPVYHKGTVRLFAYRASTGEVSFGELRSGGQGSQHLHGGTWNLGWTAFTPFVQDGVGALFAYQAGTGTAHVRTLNAGGTGTVGIWTDGWTTGWT